MYRLVVCNDVAKCKQSAIRAVNGMVLSVISLL